MTSQGLLNWVLKIVVMLTTFPLGTDSESLHFSVLEGDERNRFVGQVGEYFAAHHDGSPSLKYMLSDQSSKQYARLFKLDGNSGTLRTAEVIDREEYCRGQVLCDISVDVVLVGGGGRPTVKHAVISILDRNDNPPTFPEPDYHTSISESSPLESRISLPVATDMDSPENGMASGRYDLVSGSPPEFDLRLSDRGNLELILVAALDREEKEEYRLTVQASDGGNPNHIGSLEVVITVEDDNDHSPAFSNSSYHIDLRENFDVGPAFFTVQATDRDAGPFGTVSYKLAARTSSIYGRQFGIRADTGELYLIQELDWEDRADYNLDVIATDGGSRPRSAECTIHLTVIDVNDNAPQVSISTYTGSVIGKIKENLQAEAFIARVSVFDADDGANGEVNCTLNMQEFTLKPDDGAYILQTAQVLDRELKQFYEVQIICRDHGVPSQSSIGNISVVVLDENDHTPTFDREVYTKNFVENYEPDGYIMQLNATDPDQGENGRLSYDILGNMTAYVYIQQYGIIRASQSFDRERDPRIRFRVRVRDHGSPAKSSEALVIIRIIDENDEPPIVQQQLTPFSVRENLPARQFVGQMNASDKDSDVFNKFTFSLIQFEATDVFSIDRYSGVITTNKVLDREVRDQYQLAVVATGTERPVLSSTARIIINILDENDNFPEFKYPRSGNNTFQVSNKVPVGHGIFKATAVDKDSGLNGKVIYGIENGNEERYFSIDSSSGVLSTKANFEGIAYSAHDITLLAKDNGFQPKNTTMIIRIVIDQSVPFLTPPTAEGLVRSNNLIIIIVVASVSGFIMVILIIAIAAMKCYDRRRPTSVYKCRVEEQKILRQVALEGRQASHDSLRSCASNKSCNNRLTPPEQMLAKRETEWEGEEVHVTSREGTLTKRANGGNIYSPAPGQEQHLEAHLLALLKKDRGDTGSASSAEISTADSGRGPSEEGDQGYHTGTRHVYPANHASHTFAGKTHPTAHIKNHPVSHLKSPCDPPRNADLLQDPNQPTSTTTVITHPIPAARPAQRVNPPLRGSLHYLLKEEEDRRGRHQRKPSSNPKQSMTTFHASPPSYESVVAEDDESSKLASSSGPIGSSSANDRDNSQSEALLQSHSNGLQNIAEEECLSDGLGSDHSDSIHPHDSDSRFFRSAVV